MNKQIRKVCVIGTGVLALKCAAYAKENGILTRLYDMGEKHSVLLEKQAKASGVSCFYENPETVFQMLLKEEEPILLVSAINERIVPECVLENRNIRAINLHRALLPAHPGRNAEAWAIFEQDEKTGITWHEMTKKVDGGRILIQKEIKLDENITSYLLFKKQIEYAYEAYKEIFQGLIEGSMKGTPQKSGGVYRFHYKKDIPNEGILDLNWTLEKTSAFLRAMDYAGLSVFGKPKLIYQEKAYQWGKYEICLGEKKDKEKQMKSNLQISGENIVIQKETGCILLKKYNEMEKR